VRYSFQQYRKIFDGIVARYETDAFSAGLIARCGRPTFPSAPRQVAAFGVRREGPTVQFRENTADDTISLVRLDEGGAPQAFEYPGTTESGLFSQIVNAAGDFKMLPGFYFFRLGTHHGVNPCLVQAAPVQGERAKKGQDFTDKVWQISDGSLHIHAGIMNPQNVGSWSAGCQVIAGGWTGKAWTEFYKMCVRAALPIPYVLVNEADVPGLLA